MGAHFGYDSGTLWIRMTFLSLVRGVAALSSLPCTKHLHTAARAPPLDGRWTLELQLRTSLKEQWV